MVRSQLYLYSIVVLLLILFYFVSYLNLLNKEFQFYSDTFPQYGEIYKLLYGNDVFENILNLYGSTLIPFTVYYNCSYDTIQVPNYFNSTNVIVIDNVYNFLPSYASNNFVAFKIIDNYSISYSNTGYCIFNGYMVYNPYFNTHFQGTGNLPYYVIFYPQNIFTVNDKYLNNLYNLGENVVFQYLRDYKCIAGEIKSLSVRKMLDGISVSFLNISNARLNNNIISVNIVNNGICPINLNKIYYNNYNIPLFGNNFNTSSNSYIIYPNQQIVGYYQYNRDGLYFCLVSLGNEICTPINNLPIQYYIPITLYNTQNIPAPSPFQQQIAICNGTINIGPNFAYVNNPTLFNQIHPNGQNVMFFNPNNGQLYYSWYLGQLVNGSTYCRIWWINIPNGIPANSNIVVYMAIGNLNTNYYQQYYPYVGASPNVFPSRQYDNGKYVFMTYGYFNNTFDGWTGYIYRGTFSPRATLNGIEMLNNQNGQGTYILPYNNWNIPLIPLIVEEVWYHTSGADANVIALFGNINQQFNAYGIATPIANSSLCGGINVTGGIYTTCGGATPASNLSTFVQFQYLGRANPPLSQAAMLKSAVTNQYLNYTYFSPDGGTVYSYLIVNSTYAQAGYYIYNSNQVWVPLTLLNMYHLSYNPNYGNYTYSNLNYNPFRYPTLQISAGTGEVGVEIPYQYVQWVIVRAYPPNGVMPSIYIS
ncbi:MAG: hypothetical protein ACO2ON_01480 [Candidatus Nanopusillus sp.]